MEKTKNKYEDIINLPHHVSTTRPQMSLEERAAQFSPFAALTGFGAVIEDAKGDYHASDLEYDEEDPGYFMEER